MEHDLFQGGGRDEDGPDNEEVVVGAITSPNAMMTMRPWRSAKCPGRTIQSPPPASMVLKMSTAMAAIHRMSCQAPSVKPPTSTRAIPAKVKER